MKKLITNISVRTILLTLVTVLFFLLFIVLSVISGRTVRSLDDQQAAKRWSPAGGYAQISCFFADPIEADQYLFFRNEIETGLREASLGDAESVQNLNDGGAEAPGTAGNMDETGTINRNARVFVDAYSSQGTIVLQNKKNRLETTAMGVGGDFFLFHPVRMVSGGYFSGDDLMKDHVILDEEAAWQLFGSSDVVGMQVTINDIAHIVVGVYRRESSRMWKAAGLKDGMVFVSAETMAAHGDSAGILQYEALMPNPVSGFGYQMVKERFGFDEEAMVVVDNTARYSLEPMIGVITDFGIRSMQHYAIRYPYWENYARGAEDIVALLLLFRFVFLLIAVLIVLVVLFRAYRHRTWTWPQVMRSCGKRIVVFVKFIQRWNEWRPKPLKKVLKKEKINKNINKDINKKIKKKINKKINKKIKNQDSLEEEAVTAENNKMGKADRAASEKADSE